MPLFSTVIPVFNRAALIRATLDSVLAQKLQDQEIIVVDDGSTDATLETLATYSDRIRVFRQSNAGPSAARNLGIQHATGDYIATIDSDDLWFPWTLATYAEAIQRHDAPAFIAGAPFIFRDEHEVSTVRREPLRAEFFADYLASGNQWRWFGVSSFVLRADAVRAVGGFSTERINAEDADLALRLGEARGFVDIQSPATFAYREHAGSLKTSVDASFRGLSHLLEQEKRGAYPGDEARRRERWEILTRHIRPFTIECAKAGATGRGWSLYRRTFAWHLALRRVRYLCSYPVLAAIGLLKPNH